MDQHMFSYSTLLGLVVSCPISGVGPHVTQLSAHESSRSCLHRHFTDKGMLTELRRKALVAETMQAQNG